MGIFKRIKTIVSSGLYEALDKYENPVALLKPYLRELEQEISKAEGALSNQLYIEKKYEVIVNETEGQIAKRNRQAKLAVDREQDDIAKVALQDRLMLEKKLAIYKPQFEMIKGKSVELVEQIKKLKARYEKLQTRKMILISRANVAKVSNDIAQTFVAFNPENAERGFARMEDHILKLEAKSSVSNYLAESGAKPTNAARYMGEEVEEELKKLKEMKKVTA